MPIFSLEADKIVPVPKTSFSSEGLRERDDIQRLLRDCIAVISPNTLVLAEEFGDWTESTRRIDLLGMDDSGRLVVVELKRTEDGGHMELQALRYAAMVSTMTFEQAVETYRRYLVGRSRHAVDAGAALLAHMDTTDPTLFNSSVRVVLASAEFSKEVTSSVLWLNSQGLDVTCVRLRPYKLGSQVLLDVQQVIPLPEATEYQIAIQQQTTERREVSRSARDLTRYHLKTSYGQFERLAKRHFIFQVVKEAIRQGLTPAQIAACVPWRGSTFFFAVDGEVEKLDFMRAIDGYKTDRYFCQADELIRIGGRTYAVSNQWGARTEDAVKAIIASLPRQETVTYEALPP